MSVSVETSSRERLLLIVNPVSGKRTFMRSLPEVLQRFSDASYMVTTLFTTAANDAARFVAEWGADFDLICCAGGDGTLSEVINGLKDCNLHVPIGYFPCGSTNDFAVSHDMSTNPVEQAQRIIEGHSILLDVGKFNDKCFSYVAAFGAFSRVSYTTDQTLKNILGHTAYILEGIKDLSQIKPLHMAFEIDGISYDDEFIFGAVCNSTTVAGTIALPSEWVDMQDGKLEVLLVHFPKDLIELNLIISALAISDFDCPLIEFIQARHVEVDNPEGLEWALDGEGSGEVDHVDISVLPSFLTLRG